MPIFEALKPLVVAAQLLTNLSNVLSHAHSVVVEDVEVVGVSAFDCNDSRHIV